MGELIQEVGFWNAIRLKIERLKFLIYLYTNSKHPWKVTYILEKNWYGCSTKDREYLERYFESIGEEF